MTRQSQATRQLGSVAAGSAGVVAGALVWSGVPPLTSLAIVAVAAIQTLGGVLLVRMTVPSRIDAYGLLGLGIAVGTTASMLSGVLLGMLGWHAWSWATPTAVALVAWFVWRRKVHQADVVTVGAGGQVALGVGTLAGLASLAYAVRSYPLSWSGTITSYHPDMVFFEALGRSMARFGPLDSIFAPDTSIRYHWFVYAWDGQIAEAVGAEPFATVTRLPMLVAMLGAVLIAASWAARASKQWWVPSLAVVLILAGGNLGAVYGGVFNLDSPSQTVTAMWLLGYAYLLVLLLERARDDARVRIGAQVLLGVLMVGLAGGKISAAGVALAGIGLVTLVSLVRRERDRRAALTAGIVAVGVTGAVFVALLSGAATGGSLGLFDTFDRAASQQGLNPIEGIHGLMAGTVVLIIAVVARWSGVLYLLGMRTRCWEPQTILAVGMAAAGVVALVAFTGLNALWFAAGASAPLAVVSAIGIGEAVARAQDHARWPWLIPVGVIVAAAVVYAVVWQLWVTGPSGGNVWVSTLRWLGPPVGIVLAIVLGAVVVAVAGGRGLAALIGGGLAVVVLATAPGRLLGIGTGLIGVQPGLRYDLFDVSNQDYPGIKGDEPTEITSGFVDAATWLRKAAAPDELIATNRTFGAIVPAFTQRQTHASGVRYVAGYGVASELPTLFQRERESWAFIDEPNASTQAPLCAAGVRWALVDPAFTQARDWSPFATIAYATADAVILKLNCP